MEKQGGIYARYSPSRNRDQTSTIEVQVAMCREKPGCRSPNPLPFPTPPQNSPTLTPSETSSFKHQTTQKIQKKRHQRTD